MTVLVFGLDALDYNFVQEYGVLESLDVQHLEQDLTGANRLFTYRVWPSIFSGENAPDGMGAYEPFDPGSPFIWEELPAAVFMAPLARPEDDYGKQTFSNELQDELPENYKESRLPTARMKAGLEKLERGIKNQIEQETPLIIAVTRVPDMLIHARGHDDFTVRHVRAACELCERMCDLADDYMVVSDHGIRPDGPGGLEDHTEDAIFASSFAEASTMSELIDTFKPTIHSQFSKHQMEALGYR